MFECRKPVINTGTCMDILMTSVGVGDVHVRKSLAYCYDLCVYIRYYQLGKCSAIDVCVQKSTFMVQCIYMYVEFQ